MNASSELWLSVYRTSDLVGLLRLIDDLSWDRLNFTIPHQEQTNWCWAATADGTAHFFDAGTAWTQCSIANSALGRSDCCGSGAGGACDVYGYLDQALTTVTHFDHMTASVADFPTIDHEIDAHRPLGVRVAWSGGGAHFVAIGGYRERPDQYVHVEDPWYGPSDIAYTSLKVGYQGSGTWTHTYWTKP